MKKIQSKIKNPSVNDVLNLMIKNSATKSDIRNLEKKIKGTEEKLEDQIKNSEENIRNDMREEFKKYATREETYAMEQRIINAMALNTNKYLLL